MASSSGVSRNGWSCGDVIFGGQQKLSVVRSTLPRAAPSGEDAPNGVYNGRAVTRK